MSQNRCCVPGCGVTKKDGIALHCFPRPDVNAEKFNTWIVKIGGEVAVLDNLVVYKNRRVCHKHFEDKDAYTSRRLSGLAIPALYLPGQLFTEPVTMPALCSISGVQETQTDFQMRELLSALPSTSAAQKTHPNMPMKGLYLFLELKAENSIPIAGMHAVLHGFPNPEKDRYRFNTWLYSIGSDILGLENAHIFKFRRVCRKHFLDKYLCRNNRISNIAVPTLYLPGLTLQSQPMIPCIERKSLQGFVNQPIPSTSTGATFPSTRKELYVCDDPVPTASKASLASLSAPGTTRPTIDITQTPNSSGKTKTIAEALPTLKSYPFKPIIVDKVQDTTETTQELPSCSTTVENTDTDICDDNDDADDNSDTLVESNVCRVCLALDVEMYDLKDIELREMFQNITGIAVTENNHAILERLCWECAGRLKAAAAFRNQALLSDALLQGLASTGEKIRKNDITLIKENKDYLKSVESSSAVEVFHIVDIDPENDSKPHISENNDTEIVQKRVRNDSIILKKDSIIKEDNDQMDVEAPIATDMEYGQFDHIFRNTGEESSKQASITNNLHFREDKINSTISSPLPSCSHVEPKYPILDYLIKTPSDLKDKIKKPIIKITKRDSISKIVSKNSIEVISVLKGDAKSKNIYVKIGGISKKTSKLKLVNKTQVKANTRRDEESVSLEKFEF